MKKGKGNNNQLSLTSFFLGSGSQLRPKNQAGAGTSSAVSSIRDRPLTFQIPIQLEKETGGSIIEENEKNKVVRHLIMIGPLDVVYACSITKKLKWVHEHYNKTNFLEFL
jgi:hypothetical protein